MSETYKSETNKSETNKSATNKSETNKSETNMSTTNKSETNMSKTNMSKTNKSETNMSTTTKSETNTSTTNMSKTNKSETNMSETNTSKPSETNKSKTNMSKTDTSETGQCQICRGPAPHKCGGCHTVFYCSKEHQKADWKSHRKTCKPYKVCEDPTLGRHLIATRPIKQGDVILAEAPLIWGPSQNSVAVCLGCGTKLTREEAKPCSKCGWPMCSSLCENSPHHIPECSYTVERGDKVSINTFEVPHPTYQCVIVLRCLYQKQFLSKVWEKIDKLEDHEQERRDTGKYEHDRATMCQLIFKFMKLHTFTEEEILRVCGIVMVNGHEVPLTEPHHVAIYEATSMFEHNCRANCSKSFSSNGGVVISAGLNIQKGDHLSICYTDPLWGTYNRRNHLFESKFFWCRCERCTDPSEFGTNFNSVKCETANCKGYLLPNSFVGENHEEDWRCKSCESKISGRAMTDHLEKIGMELSEQPKGNSNACKTFIKKYENVLHKNHFHLTDVKYALSQLIGHEFHGGLPDVSEEDLELKAVLCRNIEELVQVLAPAERRLRGILLFELHAAVAEIGRKRGTKGVVGPEDLQVSLMESRRHLQASADLLKLEPEELPEGKIYKQALVNLKDIDVLLTTVIQTMGNSPL